MVAYEIPVVFKGFGNIVDVNKCLLRGYCFLYFVFLIFYLVKFVWL